MTHRLAFPARIALIAGSLILVVILATMLRGASGAAGTMRLFDWNAQADFSKEEDRPVMGTGFIPFQSTDFVPVALDVTPSRADNRPIAGLATPPKGTTSIGILEQSFTETDDPRLIAYQLASVRYQFNGQVLYISTLQPANLGVTRPLNIGRLHGDLGNGRVVYTSSEVIRDGPNFQVRRTFNVISFVENGLVVTLASEMPSEQLIELAKGVTFNAR